MSETMQSLWRGEIQVNSPVTGRQIAREIAARHNLTLEDLRSPCRARRLAWPRQEAMWTMRQRTKLSLPQIGHILGDRDHTTILHGIRRHQERIGGGAAE